MKTMMLAFSLLIQHLVSSAQTSDSTIVIHLKGPADFLVSDSLGRKTGFDPIREIDYKEIPGSEYGTGGAGSEDPNFPSIEYSEFAIDNPLGEYSVEVIGFEDGRFEMRGFFMRGKGFGKEFSLKGVIGAGQRVFYDLKYGSNSSGEMSILKRVGSATLRQDLDNCHKLNLLGAKPLFINLSHRVDKYEEWIQKGDTVKARQELEKLGKKLDEVYKKSKGPSKDPNHFIKEEAYQILKEDVAGMGGMSWRSTN